MPMFRELEYQARVLKTFDRYVAALASAKANADLLIKIQQENPAARIPIDDFTAAAWGQLAGEGVLPPIRTQVPFSGRRDGTGQPVPNVVLKIPTGGGKTYLAVSALSRIFGGYLGRNTGFVLWIVPNEAIYTQTLRQLKDRQHVYRQMLDRSAAGRVLILEKTDTLNTRDVEANLCVMLLMLQSANRETKETLKLFQDRGDVHGFFPPEGDQEAHARALAETPNLDAYSQVHESGSFWPMVKDSLGNALRTIRPVVVMDEGHHATPERAFNTLYGFNPCFVLELTATPKDVTAKTGPNPREPRYANILVDVSGVELDREGMIKMPLNLEPRQGADWKATLRSGIDRLDDLEREARVLRAEKNRYIRPIMLVQVERTGDDQRDGVHIHADDAKDWLRIIGLDDAEIAVKTANVNDLKNPENQDLLSDKNRIRVIITKHALQEGWDCPFAYILCSLAPSTTMTGMTQLVGRILRQPHAEKTGIPALDECYVITHHAETGTVVGAIKRELENNGLGDLGTSIKYDEGFGNGGGPRPVSRRHEFSDVEVYLPQVRWTENGSSRLLDYDADILYRIDWSELNVSTFVEKIPANAHAADSQLRRISLLDATEHGIRADQAGRGAESVTLDPAHMTRMISDLVPNPWIAREIVGRVLAGLLGRDFSSERLGELSGLLIDELRKWLDACRSERAEALFRSDVESGKVQFRLHADRSLDWQMPFEYEFAPPENARQLWRNGERPVQLSLFTPVYEEEFNTEERNVAVYLDRDETIRWWHRNVARTQYALQGWRKEKIYPDFVFAVKRDGKASKIAIVETKGDFLAGSDDSIYKRDVLHLLSENFSWDTTLPVGQFHFVRDGSEDLVECDLVLMSEWQTRLPQIIGAP